MNADRQTSFDFRRPPPGGFEGKVAGWLSAACAAAARIWPRWLAFPAELKLDKVESITTAAALQRLPDEAIGIRLSLLGSPNQTAVVVANDSECLLGMPRPLYLALIAGSLGDAVAELPADRTPTDVEEAVGRFLIQHLLLAPLKEAWPLTPGLPLAIAQRGTPRKICPLPPSDVALLASFAVETPFGRHELDLLVSRSGPVRQLVRPEASPTDSRASDRTQIESLICEMQTELSVVLGTAEVPLSRLKSLAEGDLLVLGQRVTEPLSARVADVEKFLVWPGLIKRRQAVQVEAAVS